MRLLHIPRPVWSLQDLAKFGSHPNHLLIDLPCGGDLVATTLRRTAPGLQGYYIAAVIVVECLGKV
jgi:predicted TPR repeat methyltransferase